MIFEGKRILVTGGTGSMGRALVRRLLGGQMGTPSKVIVLSRDEAKQHAMRLEFLHKRVTTDEVIYRNFKQTLEFRIGNVRSYADVCSAVRDADIVVNAAALKQVPTAEYNPFEVVKTNILGSQNVIEASLAANVARVIALSTDKAAAPINLYGAT
ncbi:MAG: polysaccharide biosynthesis protein, partial [Phycisphaerae bacterium]|nr:polysaccharide biosynthesis protein [Phycisphaerae bacterium]